MFIKGNLSGMLFSQLLKKSLYLATRDEKYKQLILNRFNVEGIDELNKLSDNIEFLEKLTVISNERCITASRKIANTHWKEFYTHGLNHSTCVQPYFNSLIFSYAGTETALIKAYIDHQQNGSEIMTLFFCEDQFPVPTFLENPPELCYFDGFSLQWMDGQENGAKLFFQSMLSLIIEKMAQKKDDNIRIYRATVLKSFNILIRYSISLNIPLKQFIFSLFLDSNNPSKLIPSELFLEEYFNTYRDSRIFDYNTNKKHNEIIDAYLMQEDADYIANARIKLAFYKKLSLQNRISIFKHIEGQTSEYASSIKQKNDIVFSEKMIGFKSTRHMLCWLFEELVFNSEFSDTKFKKNRIIRNRIENEIYKRIDGLLSCIEDFPSLKEKISNFITSDTNYKNLKESKAIANNELSGLTEFIYFLIINYQAIDIIITFSDTDPQETDFIHSTFQQYIESFNFKESKNEEYYYFFSRLAGLASRYSRQENPPSSQEPEDQTKLIADKGKYWFNHSLNSKLAQTITDKAQQLYLKVVQEVNFLDHTLICDTVNIPDKAIRNNIFQAIFKKIMNLIDQEKIKYPAQNINLHLNKELLQTEYSNNRQYYESIFGHSFFVDVFKYWDDPECSKVFRERNQPPTKKASWSFFTSRRCKTFNRQTTAACEGSISTSTSTRADFDNSPRKSPLSSTTGR